MTESTDDTPRQIWIDPNDPEMSKLAHTIVTTLLEERGEPMAIGTLFIALSEILIAVLHMPSPNAAVNISAIRRLLDALRENVLHHEQCAWDKSDMPRTEIIETPKGLVH